MSNIKTPHAAVVVYNYKVRGSLKDLTSSQANSVNVIKITDSITSIKTLKHKAVPSGDFSITLAPSSNWVARLTPGSWLSIHMAQREITEDDLNNFNKETLRMIGRIDTVRVSIDVDAQTGTRNTSYTISGKDWGQALETSLFIDPMVLDQSSDQIGQAVRLGLGVLVAGANGQAGWSSPYTLMDRILTLWGSSDLASKQGASVSGITQNNPQKLFPYSNLIMPTTLRDAMGASNSNLSSILRNRLSAHSGSMRKYGKISPMAEAIGAIDAKLVIGAHPVWGILNEASNPLLSELITEISFDNDNAALPTLYRRIKPFNVTADPNKTWYGSYFNITRTKIPADDVIRIETGTNWRDSYNFATVIPDTSLLTGQDALQVSQAVMRVKGGIINNNHQISREGLRPFIASTRFVPLMKGAQPKDSTSVAAQTAINSSGGPVANLPELTATAAKELGNAKTYDKNQINIEGLVEWSKLISQWYFNTQNMLNGTISFMGQSDYIAAGNNIHIDATLLGDTAYIEPQIDNKTTQALLHIESVQHRFTYSPQAGRSFVTDIAFVRGVFTDDKCTKLFSTSEFAVEIDNSEISDPLDENLANVYKS